MKVVSVELKDRRSSYPALLEAAGQGRVRIALPNSGPTNPILERVAPDGTAARLLDEDRGER